MQYRTKGAQLPAIIHAKVNGNVPKTNMEATGPANKTKNTPQLTSQLASLLTETFLLLDP